jgi:glycosyltransferase involved in cell wall biosynthesis
MQEFPPPPDVSVCVPAYNGAEFLEECLVSVATQSGVTLEIIFFDDFSSDGSLEIAQKVSALHPNIRWLIRKNPSRLGMTGNWNACIAETRGEFIKLMGQDDALLPGCLERQVKAMRANSGVSVAAGARVVINRDGRQLFKVPSPFPLGTTSGPAAAQRSLLSGTNRIGDPVAILIRKNHLNQVGPFNAKILYCTDMEMWLRLLAYGDLFFDPTPVALYRVHGRATGQSLRAIVPQDYINSLNTVEELFPWRITPIQKFWIRQKSRFLGLLRNAVYAMLRT